MGMDMVGYMVVGPKTLPTDRAAIIEVLRLRVVLLQNYLDKNSGGSTGPRCGYSPESPDLSRIHKGLAKLNFEWEDLEYAVSLDPKRAVDDLYDLWANGAPDVMSRTIGKKLVVSAGAETWIDALGGFGYTTLRDAELLGLLDDLGIE